MAKNKKPPARPVPTPVRTQINLTISIIESKCTAFSFTPYGISKKNEVKFYDYEFEYTLHFDVIDGRKEANVRAETRLIEKATEDAEKHKLAELNATVGFSIVNFDELVTRKADGKLEIKNPLIEFCFNTTLATIRGMYSIKLENSLYSNAILPLSNINHLMQKR